MSCCGQRATIPATVSRATSDSRRPKTPGARSVTIRYLGTEVIVIRGTATGRRYGFSGGSPVQIVDMRDAATLLRSGLFR
jgi:hypothetical protein